MNNKTKKMTTVAMLCAIAYVVMAVGRIPIVLFLKYDPKDVVITLGGLIWGPLTSCIASVIVSFIEMMQSCIFAKANIILYVSKILYQF